MQATIRGPLVFEHITCGFVDSKRGTPVKTVLDGEGWC